MYERPQIPHIPGNIITYQMYRCLDRDYETDKGPMGMTWDVTYSRMVQLICKPTNPSQER